MGVRRLWGTLVVLGAVSGLAGCSGSAPAATASVSVPGTPLGRQITYAIELANGQVSPASYPAHFSADFRAKVPTTSTASVVSQLRPSAPWHLERFLVGPTGNGAVFVIKSRYGSQTKVTILLEASTNLISGLLYQPYEAGGTTPTTTVSPALVTEATTIADELGAGQFSSVRSRFDATMTVGLTESGLAGAWQQYAGPLGAYRDHGHPIFKALSPGQQTAFVPMEFASGTLEIEVSFNPAGQVSGFYIRPAGFDQSV